MRRPAMLAVLLLGGCAMRAPAPMAVTARPMRVMSLNQCTDQLVLALLPPSRIASVTWLSRDPRYSAMVGAAGAVAINRGTIEEVAATHPDLIVTDTFSNPAGRALIGRLNLPLLALTDAGDVAAIRRNVRRLGAALGEPVRAATLIARMDRQLAVQAGPAPAVRVAVWGRDGAGETSLLAGIVAAAGLHDVTPVAGADDVEGLLRAAPDFLIESGASDGGASLGDLRRNHPLVRRRWPPSRVLRVPVADTICGTPAIGDAAAALRAQAQDAIGRGA